MEHFQRDAVVERKRHDRMIQLIVKVCEDCIIDDGLLLFLVLQWNNKRKKSFSNFGGQSIPRLVTHDW
jgi:hypothetical protein